MRGTRAKAIRQSIFGDLSLKNRRYFKLPNGQIVADELRQKYQKAKKKNDKILR